MAYAGDDTRRQRSSPNRSHQAQPRRRGTQTPGRSNASSTVPDPGLAAMLDRLREAATAHDGDYSSNA